MVSAGVDATRLADMDGQFAQLAVTCLSGWQRYQPSFDLRARRAESNWLTGQPGRLDLAAIC